MGEMERVWMLMGTTKVELFLPAVLGSEREALKPLELSSSFSMWSLERALSFEVSRLSFSVSSVCTVCLPPLAAVNEGRGEAERVCLSLPRREKDRRIKDCLLSGLSDESSSGADAGAGDGSGVDSLMSGASKAAAMALPRPWLGLAWFLRRKDALREEVLTVCRRTG